MDCFIVSLMLRTLNVLTLNTPRTYLNWSTGKDSAMALYQLQQNESYTVAHLLTSINAAHNRVSMHGLRRSLMLEQLNALGIPYSTIELPEEPSMEVYETLMKDAVGRLQADGFTCAAFGDIFLEDLRKYREEQLGAMGIQTLFPLWKNDTSKLLTEFIRLGFKAIVVCVNADLLDESFAGRLIDASFLEDLPANVDACGENGEFHTFCFDGPIFKNPVAFTKGENIYREYKVPVNSESDTPEKKIGFWFCDLLPLS
jgi:uncharacterized protein (TIGR00290 family)